MGTADYEFHVNSRADFVRVRITYDRGHVVKFTIQYEALVDDQYRNVVRYDTPHGFPHRDTLNWDGTTLKKEPMQDAQTLDEAATVAITDLVSNREQYLEDFLRRRP